MCIHGVREYARRYLFEDFGGDGRIIKMDLKKIGFEWESWTGLIWLRIQTVDTSQGTIKCGNFLAK